MPSAIPALLRAILVWALIMLGESAHGVLRRLAGPAQRQSLRGRGSRNGA